MGDWYVIANIPTFIERDAFNAIESYELDSDGNIDWYDDAGNLIEPYVPVPGLEAASVFNAYYEACGGAKAFETTKSSRAVTRMDAEGGTVYTITTESLYGTGFVASYEANGQVMMENVVTIEDGFKRQMGINQKMSTSEYDRLRPQIYLDRLLHLSELQGTAEVLGSYATNGTSQYVVRINYADGSEETFHIPLQMARAEKENPYANVKWTVLKDWAWAYPTYSFDLPTGKKVKSMMIDASQLMADINRENNSYGVTQ